MVSDIVAFIYAYTTLELLLDVGAVIYAYRLTRITGAFRGWILMIVAVALITVQTTSSILSLVLFFPESQLESLISSVGGAAIVQSAVLGIGTSLVLFLAMFELFRTFKRVQSRSA